MKKEIMAQYLHQKTFSIAWGDMDALGHVNNGRYFDYFQEARIEWLKDLGIGLTGDTGPVVIHVAATFLKPIIYPAIVLLGSNVSHVGTSSMILDHHLYQDGVLMAHGTSKIVWINYEEGKSVPLPEIFRSLKIKNESKDFIIDK